MEFDNLKWPSIIDWPFSLFLPLLILIFSDATTKMLGRLRIDMLPNQQQGAAGDAPPPPAPCAQLCLCCCTVCVKTIKSFDGLRSRSIGRR